MNHAYTVRAQRDYPLGSLGVNRIGMKQTTRCRFYRGPNGTKSYTGYQGH